jgi:predicted nuclease of predicted toxin-antitoxin system
MRFLIDAQLPPALAGWLRERGVGAENVAEQLGGQTPDEAIAAYATRNGLVLLTKDDDFALRYPPDDYQLVWLRCGNISNRALRAWLEPRWEALSEKLAAGERFIEVR